MTTNFEKINEVSGVLTLTITAEDYAPEVKKQLNRFCQKANVPGFRPGKLPMGMAQKLYGAQAKMEAVNAKMSAALEGYIQESGRHILAEPMLHEGQEPLDIEKGEEFTMQFDLGFAPEFEITLSADDKVAYTDITVTDEDVDNFFKSEAQRHGHNDSVSEYEDGDMLRGILAEVIAEGEEREGAVLNEKATLMPRYFKNEEQKALFAGCKKNDVLTFCPATACEDNDVQLASMLGLKKEEVEGHKGEFTFQVDDISRYVPAEVNEAFYAELFPEEEGITEEKAQEKVREILTQQYAGASDARFANDLRTYCLEKVGALPFPEEILKRFMKERNKEREDVEKFVEENFAGALEALRWQLIEEKLLAAHEIKLEKDDVFRTACGMARYQFAQYGMQNVPEEYVRNYAESLLKDKERGGQIYEQAMGEKLVAAMKNVVTLEHKAVNAKDF